MQSIESESDTKKLVSKLSKSKKRLSSDQIDNEIGYHERIAFLAYQKAEKRGFSGSEADAVRDWLEAEKEVISSIHNS